MINNFNPSMPVKACYAAVFILLLITPLFAVVQERQWGKLTVKDNSFTIMMPGKPIFSQRDEKTADGASHIFNASAYPGMSFTEYTVRAITDEFDSQFDTRLDDLCDALVKESNLKVVSRKEISLGTYRGREITAISEMRSAKARVYVNGRRAFVVLATVPPGSRNTEDIEKFLDSFEINPKSSL